MVSLHTKTENNICCECLENEVANVITFKQQRIILKAIKVPKYLNFFYFCCCTGMRVGEALSIKTKDINKKKHIIHITMPDSCTKKHTRVVPYLPDLFYDMDLSGEYLFEDVTDDGSRQYFCNLYKELDLNLTRHSTRHTFISVCHHIGIDDEQIQEWAGHTNIKMTTETYTHLLEKGTSPILNYLKRLKQNLKH